MFEITTVEFISNTGFPIAVCMYLLWERDKRTKELTVVMTEMNVMMKTIIKRCI